MATCAPPQRAGRKVSKDSGGHRHFVTKSLPPSLSCDNVPRSTGPRPRFRARSSMDCGTAGSCNSCDDNDGGSQDVGFVDAGRRDLQQGLGARRPRRSIRRCREGGDAAGRASTSEVSPGTFTSWAGDALAGAFGSFASMDDKALQASFNRIDAHSSGLVSKKRMRKYLKRLGLTSEEVRAMCDSIGDEELTFEDFKEMLQGPSADQPVDIMRSMTSWAGGALLGAFGSTASLSDEEIVRRFQEADLHSRGQLEPDEVAELLLRLGKTEAEIRVILESIRGYATTLDELKVLLRENLAHLDGLEAHTEDEEDEGELWVDGEDEDEVQRDKEGAELLMSLVPSIEEVKDMTHFLGDTLKVAFVGFASLSDEELRQKFNEIDVDSSGELNLAEVEGFLLGLGKTDIEIRIMFEGFRGLPITFRTFTELVRDSVSKAAVSTESAQELCVPTSFSGASSSSGSPSGTREALIQARASPVWHAAPLPLARGLAGTLQPLSASRHVAPAEEDAPSLGLIPSMDEIRDATSWASSAFLQALDSFGGRRDDKLRHAFDTMDVKRTGRLSRSQVGGALLLAGKTDEEVSDMFSRYKWRSMNFDQLKAMTIPYVEE